MYLNKGGESNPDGGSFPSFILGGMFVINIVNI